MKAFFMEYLLQFIVIFEVILVIFQYSNSYKLVPIKIDVEINLFLSHKSVRQLKSVTN